MNDAVSIAWLAGILEGEGYFTARKGSSTIRVKMGDKDVIERVAKMWGTTVKTREDRRPNNNTMYETAIYGQPARDWMKKIYLLMGNRRKAKIMEIILLIEDKNANSVRRKKPKAVAAE